MTSRTNQQRTRGIWSLSSPLLSYILRDREIIKGRKLIFSNVTAEHLGT